MQQQGRPASLLQRTEALSHPQPPTVNTCKHVGTACKAQVRTGRRRPGCFSIVQFSTGRGFSIATRRKQITLFKLMGPAECKAGGAAEKSGARRRQWRVEERSGWGGGRREKNNEAYVFFSFDPLVSLLNGLQVLKMQLHQSINLERVKACRRCGGRGASDEGGEREGATHEENNGTLGET